MSEIIDFGAKVLERGNLMFLGCKCGSEDGFGAAVAQGKDTPVITDLVCMDCGQDYPVLMGNVGE